MGAVAGGGICGGLVAAGIGAAGFEGVELGDCATATKGHTTAKDNSTVDAIERLARVICNPF